MAEKESMGMLKKYIEFFSGMTAKNVMNHEVIALTEQNTIREAQEIMKQRKISGLPVVNENNYLKNIISMEDIIKALEKNEMGKCIADLPKKTIIYLSEEDSFEEVFDHVTQYGFGRYPVIDADGKLVGIVTKQDLLFSVVARLSTLYLHDERRKEILDSNVSNLSEFIKNNINRAKADFIYDINNQDVSMTGTGSALLKGFLKKSGIDDAIVRKISIAVYEAEVNVVIHGGGIGRIIANHNEESMVVLVEDQGPGIEDIEKALKPGFSTATEEIRSQGFGAGMGLPNMKRCSDKLVITSEKNKGVKVEMLFWLNSEKK